MIKGKNELEIPKSSQCCCSFPGHCVSSECVIAKEHSMLAEGIADIVTMEGKIRMLLEMCEFKMDTMEIG